MTRWQAVAWLGVLIMARSGAVEPAPTVAILGQTPNAFTVAAEELGLGVTGTPGVSGCPALVVCATAYPRVEPLAPEVRQQIDRALAAGQGVYVEYAPWDGRVGERPAVQAYERLVVESGLGLPPLAVLEEHSSQALPWLGGNGQVLLRYARVAGYDHAVFGLPPESAPALVLERRGEGRLMLATTALSHSLTGRYKPTAAWRELAREVLLALLPERAAADLRARWVDLRAWTEPREWAPPGEPVHLVVTAPGAERVSAVGPDGPLPLTARAEGEWVSPPLTLPAGQHELRVSAERAGRRRDAAAAIEVSPRAERYRQAVTRNLQWLERAGLLIAPDGSLGVREGLTSTLGPDGRPQLASGLRVDGVSEVALAAWTYGRLTGDATWGERGRRMLDYVGRAFQVTARDSWYYGHWQSRGEVADTGTIYVFNDDSGAATLMSLLGYAATGDRRLLTAGLRGVEYFAHVASERTGLLGWMPHKDYEGSGPLGTAWPVLRGQEVKRGSPHVQGLPLASLLVAYQLTGEPRYLALAERGVGTLMKLYPDWAIETSRSCEHARMLLPLALIQQVAPSDEHRRWLDQVTGYLLGKQAPCGAITEWDGHNPATNAAYGTGENSVFQRNGEPVSDQLYDTGFALLHLALAARVTGGPAVRAACERLGDYLTRIQLREEEPRYDGGWLRAFDYERWEYFGSSADIGWGPYCAETGWMAAPIDLGLMLALGDALPPWLPTRTDPALRPLAEAARRDADAVEAGLTAKPPAVTDLSAEPSRGPYAVLHWTAPANQPCSYELHRSVDAAFTPAQTTRVAVIRGGQWLDVGLEPEATYYYRLVAINGLLEAAPPTPALKVIMGPVSKARGCRYTKSLAPHAGYPDPGDRKSTDGVLAGAYRDGRSYGYRLAEVGDAVAVDVTIDLGREQTIARATAHLCGAPAYRPDRVTVSVSSDGQAWRPVGYTELAVGDTLAVDFAEHPARYVRFAFTKQRRGTQDDWLFLDELEVY